MDLGSGEDAGFDPADVDGNSLTGPTPDLSVTSPVGTLLRGQAVPGVV